MLSWETWEWFVYSKCKRRDAVSRYFGADSVNNKKVTCIICKSVNGTGTQVFSCSFNQNVVIFLLYFEIIMHLI